jgi:membrane-associated phospholipid phosphatase
VEGAAAADAHTQIDAERWLSGGTLPTVWLQDHLWDAAHPHVYDDAVWAIYNTHFVGVLVVAAVLWRVSHERFLRFRAVIAALTLAACATFRARPTTPPSLAVPRAGAGRVDRIIDVMWRHVSVQRGSPLFEHGTRWANQYAAWPSLHAAFPFVLLLFFWASAPVALRVVLVGYVVAMAFTLVYTGDHYVVDILGGWAYAGAAFALVEAAYRVAPARAGGALVTGGRCHVVLMRPPSMT